MTVMEFVEDQFRSIVLFFIATLSAGISWIFRTIFTNGKRIDMLEMQYKQVHQDLQEIKAQNTKLMDAIINRNLGSK